ncbi:MAG: large-conductance mechanosensitive channel protein MscL [Eubacterium sp.]|nr:large-conductance mechanosensitive channel protein MscL [Eubacterium sp.]
MKGFMKEFKEFITKGDVMSMAVGIIIGGAFTAIVGSLVADIITPLLGIVLGGLDFSSLSVTVGSAVLTYGNFIQAIITFLLTALVIFWLMKAFNKMKKEEPAPEPEPEPEPSEEVKLLTEIRDALKK